MSGRSADTREYEQAPSDAKEHRDGGHRIGDVLRKLGTSGRLLGTNGGEWRTFFITFAIAAVVVGAVNAINVVTRLHEEPRIALGESIIWEITSWVTWLTFLWIGWFAYRVAPPRRPYWRLVIHVPGAILFSLGHVGGFVLLRKLIYAGAGGTYHFGAFWPQFTYEFSKDAFGYVLMIASFAINERVLRLIAPQPSRAEAKFAIRDGARIMRVPMAEILAISSAGNYVEFVLRDGRKPLMRSPLATIESELAPHGFVRVHRSWLVNPTQMTALKPDGSGDYTVELGQLAVPLSRRFPEALARLRAN